MNTKILLSIAIASVSLTGCLGLENLTSNNNNDDTYNSQNPPPPPLTRVGGCSQSAYNIHLNPSIYSAPLNHESAGLSIMSDGSLTLSYNVMDSTATQNFGTSLLLNPLPVTPGICAAQYTIDTIQANGKLIAGPLDNKVISLSSCSYPVEPISQTLHFTAVYTITDLKDYNQSSPTVLKQGTIKFECYVGRAKRKV